MGRVLVTKARMDGDKIGQLEVKIHGLEPRVIDRATALSWMKDGHSFLPSPGPLPGRALQLMEAGDEIFIRDDHEALAADSLPELPAL